MTLANKEDKTANITHKKGNTMSRLIELIQSHPIRKSDAEKAAFRDWVVADMTARGCDARVEENSKHKNVVIGDPTSADVVFTAHYDTPATSLFPNIMIPRHRTLFYLYQFVPVIVLLAISLGLGYLVGEVILGSYEAYLVSFLALYYGGYFLMFRTFSNKNNYNDNTSGVAAVLSIADALDESAKSKVAFILFDNEEKGKKGSKAYFADHKDAMAERLVINLDCVGNGDNMVFISKKKALESPLYTSLCEAFASDGGYTTHFFTYKEADANSDHKSFPAGVGCVACNRSKHGILLAGRIHTNRDVVAKDENIEFLTRGVIKFVSTIK